MLPPSLFFKPLKILFNFMCTPPKLSAKELRRCPTPANWKDCFSYIYSKLVKFAYFLFFFSCETFRAQKKPFIYIFFIACLESLADVQTSWNGKIFFVEIV